jgi:protein O-mannosyl-transferase
MSRRGARRARVPASDAVRASSVRPTATLAPAIAALLIVLAGAWAYSPSFRGVFVWDDSGAIVENAHVRALWPLSESMTAPLDTTLAGRPVASLSFAIDYALAPVDVRDVMKPDGPARRAAVEQRYLDNVWRYHATNLLVHLLASLALFGVVRRTLQSSRLQPIWAEHATIMAAAVALIWAVHPLNTQAVTYVVQRVESLMGLFYLLTLYCAIRAGHEGAGRAWWIAGAVLACLLGMGTKEVMVTAPIVVVLWDYWFAPAGVSRRRWPLYAGLASTWALLALLLASPSRTHSVGFGLGGWTSWAYLQTQAEVIVHYLRLAIVPDSLVFDYQWPRAASLWAVAPQAAALVMLFAATALAVVRRWPVGFLGAWFFLILAPTSSVLPIATEVAAEHRMYLPLVAVVAAAVLGVAAAGFRWAASTEATARSKRLLGGVSLLAVAGTAVALGQLTRDRNQVYWSNDALMLDTIAKRPANNLARFSYTSSLVSQGRYAEAEAQARMLLTAEGTAEWRAHTHLFLGTALCATGRVGEGIRELEAALALAPTLTDANALLGEAYDGLGRTAEAAEQFAMAVAGTPDNPTLLRRVSWFLSTTPDAGVRNGRRAVELAERAKRLTDGRDPFVLESLGAAYAEADRFAEAERALGEAAALARAMGDAAFLTVVEQELAAVRAGRKLHAGQD